MRIALYGRLTSVRRTARGWTRLEPFAEVLRLVDHFPILEFHDAHRVKRLRVVGKDEFADPEIAATEHASDREPLRVRLRFA